MSPNGFAGLTPILMDIAGETCKGRLGLTLEGDYNLEGLRDSVKAVLKELRGESTIGEKDWSGEVDERMLASVLEKVS